MKKMIALLVAVLGILTVAGTAMAEPGGSVTLRAMDRGGIVILR